MAPGLRDTITPMPVSISGTLKSMAPLRSVVTFSEVNVRSARFSSRSANETIPFILKARLSHRSAGMSREEQYYSHRISCSPCAIQNLIEFEFEFQPVFEHTENVDVKPRTALVVPCITVIGTSRSVKARRPRSAIDQQVSPTNSPVQCDKSPNQFGIGHPSLDL